MVVCEHSHGDLFEPLPAQTDVELLEPKLRIHTEQLAEVAQRVLLLIGLGGRLIGECLKSLGSFALLGDAAREGLILLKQSAVRLDAGGLV